MAALRCDVIHGDNLQLLQDLHSELTFEPDLIYADPPFNSNRDYNQLVKGSAIHQQAYGDTWRWKHEDLEAQKAYEKLVNQPLTPELATFLKAQHSILVGTNSNLLSYLITMTPRLYWMHQVLKETGSMVLHCDPTASHYLKALMDVVFGHQNFLGEVIWKRHSNANNARRPGPIHDVLLVYAKSDDYKWRGGFHKRTTKANVTVDPNGRMWVPSDATGPGAREGSSGQLWNGVSPNTKKPRHWAIGEAAKTEYLDRTGQELKGNSQEMLSALDAVGLIHWTDNNNPRIKRYVDPDSEEVGAPLQDVWTDISGVHSSSQEFRNFETQKPLALLTRIIEMLTDPGDMVLDPYTGSGTTAIAALRAARNFAGFEYEVTTTLMAKDRIAQEQIELDSIPVLPDCPNDPESRQLLNTNDPGRRKIQEWAVRRLGGIVTPHGGSKGDGGIDGNIVINGFADKTAKNAIVSVKSASMTLDQVEAFCTRRAKLNADDDVQGKAIIGIIVCRADEITPGMRSLAFDAGSYILENGVKKAYPRIQFVTFDMIDDRTLDMCGMRLPGIVVIPDYSQVPDVVERRSQNQERRGNSNMVSATSSLFDGDLDIPMD